MNTENQYDAIAERYDSLFNDKASIKEKEKKIEESLSQEATEYIEMACPHCGEIIRMKK